MALTFDQAVKVVYEPGTRLELTTATIRGVEMQVFKNSPQHLGQLFDAARGYGDRNFIVYEGETWSFAKVMEQVDALAHALVHVYGVKKGDRVAVSMRNYPEWIVSFAAIISVGAISVSMNSWWTEDEIDFALGDCGAVVLIADQQRLDLAHKSCRTRGVKMLLVRAEREVGPDVDEWDKVLTIGVAHPGADIDLDDDATILYTSGTTGHPKGAVSTHRALISALLAFSARGAVDALRVDNAPTEDLPMSFILIVPLFHVTGCVAVMLGCFVAGLKLVIMYKWDPEKALQIIQDEQITAFIGVPTQSWDLVNHPRFAEFDTSSLRAVGGGGAPAPASLVAKVSNSVKSGSPQLGYGMTETNAFGPGNRGQDYLDRPTSTGRWVPPMKVEVRDEAGHALPVGERGEIWFFGPMLIRGYWNRPDATAETIVDGWLRSGDAGRIDAEGFVFVEDRIKDMILRGGENIFCAEIEGAIYEHPGVHEVAVFGVPHERLGEEVAVAIWPNEGAVFSATDVWKLLDGKIASYKVPTHVVIMNEALPRNAAGKFLKRELAQLVIKGALKAVSR